MQRACGSGSGTRGARGAERRESDTRARVRVRALRGSRGRGAGRRRAAARGRGLEAGRWGGRSGEAEREWHVRTEFKLPKGGQMSLVHTVAVSGR